MLQPLSTPLHLVWWISVFKQIKDDLELKLRPVLDTLEVHINQAADKAQMRAGDFVADDDKMRFLLVQIHSRLPFPLRMAVGEQKFVEFCLRNRTRLLKK